MHKKSAAVAAIILAALGACSPPPVTAEPHETPLPEPSPMILALSVKDPVKKASSEIALEPEITFLVEKTYADPAPVQQNPWADYELNAMARTLAGECYDDKAEDKRKVCEAILNRVVSPDFPNTILEVLTAENAFQGYWHQSRDITEDDLMIAETVLRDWYANGCRELSGWLYFSAGANRENVFRTTY